MPTGNAVADAMTRSADQRGEASIQDVLSQGFAPDVPITPTLDAGSFVKQSKDILGATYNNPAIPQLFGRVERSGNAAADALDIIDEQYRQEEMKRLPLEGLQNEVDDLQARRARVLPELLSDDKIIDFNAKLRLSSMLQSMFDREIDKTLNKKKALEEGAANRAKLKADTMRARASVLDKKLQSDQYLLSNALDMFEAGSGSLQDILEAAVQMQENAAKRAKDGAGGANPFIGVPGQDFTDFEIATFLKADKNFGRLDVPDSVGKNQKFMLNQRYYQWQQSGKPVRVAQRADGPPSPGGVVPSVMNVLSAIEHPELNTFPEPASSDILMELLNRGDEPRGVGEVPEE